MAIFITFAKETINHLRDKDNVFRTIKVLFHHIGLWPKLRGSSIIPPIPLLQTWCPRFLLIVSVYFTLISSPVKSYQRRNESILQILEPLSFTFLASLIFVHVLNLLYRGESFERMFRTLHEMRACAARYPLRPKAVRARAKLYTDLVLAYILQLGLGGTSFLIFGFPILMRSRKFMFGSWYPYEATASPYYELTTLVWFFYLFLGAGVMCIMNALLMYLFAITIAHIRLLRFTLENIKALSVLKVEKGMVEYVSKPNSDDQTEQEFSLLKQRWNAHGGGSLRRVFFIKLKLNMEMETNISFCVRHQQVINRFMDDIGSAFGLVLTHQLNCSLIPTAMSVVLIVFAKEFNIKILMFISLTIMAFVNLFLFCWLAQEIANETMLVGESAYSSDWFEASKSFKRSVLVMMTRCNQPLVLFIAGFIPFNIDLCIKMMKMTYSYYMSAVETLDMQRAAEDAADQENT